jgi:hypothetical protein
MYYFDNRYKVNNLTKHQLMISTLSAKPGFYLERNSTEEVMIRIFNKDDALFLRIIDE